MLVLVGLDDSPSSVTALRFADRVVKSNSGSLCAIRSWMYGRLSALPGSTVPDPKEMDATTAATTAALVAATLGTAADVEVSVVRGPAAQAILAEVQHRHPAFAVVGRRGLGPIDSRLLGSVGRRLMESAPCPVVLMAEDAAIVTSERPVIMVGLDGSPESMTALHWASGLVTTLDGELVVAHVAGSPFSDTARTSTDTEPENPILAEASARLAAAGVRHRVILSWGDPRSTLEDIAATEGADLLVVATRGMGSVAKLVVGSVAEYLAQHCELPVAVVPPADRGRTEAP